MDEPQRAGRAVAELRDAHAPVDGAVPGRRVHARGLDDQRAVDAGDLLGVLGRERLQRTHEVVIATGARFDERTVDQSFLDDDVRHGREERHVGAWLQRQPERGEVAQLQPPRVDDDELGAVVAHGRLHLQRNDGVILGGIRAGDDEAVAVNDFGGRVAHGRRAERLEQRDDAGSMTETRAMIHVVGSEQGAEHLLHEIVVFVGSLGTAVDGHGLAAIALVDFHQPIGHVIERLVPARLAPLAAVERLRAPAGLLPRLADERRRHAVGVIHEVVAEAPLHAQVALVDDGIVRRRDAVDEVILDVQVQVAADAAIGTGGGDNSVGLDHVVSTPVSP